MISGSWIIRVSCCGRIINRWYGMGFDGEDEFCGLPALILRQCLKGTAFEYMLSGAFR